jgi:Mrp family chromosome partitioning ATPase
MTLADSEGCRVLLVDANRANPGLHAAFGLTNDVGLSEWLRQEIDDLPLRAVSSAITIVTAGRGSAGVPNADAMRALLDRCARGFDWVLIDSPAVSGGSDARLLARAVDGTVFVISAAHTPFPVVEQAMAEIGRDAIIGTHLRSGV